MVACWALSPHAYDILFALFLVAALTDWLDGFLARKWKVQTPLGAMLDQIADKLLVTTLLVLLSIDARISVVAALLLILREIWVSGLREYVGTQGVSMPVSLAGKVKTALQLIALTCLLFAYTLPHGMWRETFEVSGHASLWFAVIASLISAWKYSRLLWMR